MPLEGLRWSRDSGSALCVTPQTAVLGRAGGGDWRRSETILGDFYGDLERFPEIFPHQREREKNAAKKIVPIDNQSIIHKTLHLLTIEPRRGPMLEKRGSRTHLKVKRTLKGIIFLCRCRFFHTPTKQVLLIFCHFDEFFTTEDYFDHTRNYSAITPLWVFVNNPNTTSRR